MTKATAQMGGLTRFEIEKMRSYDPNNEGPLTPTGLRIWQSICDLALQGLSLESVRSEALEEAAKVCEPTVSDLLLATGEMTPQELRSVRATLKLMAKRIRALSPARVAEDIDLMSELKKRLTGTPLPESPAKEQPLPPPPPERP